MAPLPRYSGSGSGCQRQRSTHLHQALPLLPEQRDECQAEGQAFATWQALIGSKSQGLRNMLAADHLQAGKQVTGQVSRQAAKHTA